MIITPKAGRQKRKRQEAKKGREAKRAKGEKETTRSQKRDIANTRSPLASKCCSLIVNTPSRPHALTPSRPHALTPSRPHALTASRPHALTPSRPHALTPSRPHALTPWRPLALLPWRRSEVVPVRSPPALRAVDWRSLDRQVEEWYTSIGWIEQQTKRR